MKAVRSDPCKNGMRFGFLAVESWVFDPEIEGLDPIRLWPGDRLDLTADEGPLGAVAVLLCKQAIVDGFLVSCEPSPVGGCGVSYALAP